MPTMTGADRFQLFLDTDGRKNTGIGNVIKTHIILEGILTREHITEIISKNKAIEYLSSLTIKRKWYTFKLFWVVDKKPKIDKIISYSESKTIQELISKALKYDCIPNNNSPIHFNAIIDTEQKQTHIIISVNHSLLDYAGMELLLKSFSKAFSNLILQKSPPKPFPILKRLLQTAQATAFVAKRSGWNIQRLGKTSVSSIPDFRQIKISNEELQSGNNSSETGSLPRYLACSVYALNKNTTIFKDNKLPIFIPVPLNRRAENYKMVLLSNRFSFLFFRANAGDLQNVKRLEKIFLQQMILQAKQNMPEKFESLLSIFSLLPNFIYRAFLNLPSKGHSSTFAFSNLSISILDNGSFLGMKVIDFSHYPPFLSPPGLNLVIMEMKDGIKILSSYDSTRISNENANLLLQDIKSNLINS